MQFKQRLESIYLRVVKANDTPHRIALGFAIGIFYGLFPFVGLIFTFVTAIVFKANKAAAFVGCFVTNTWMTAFLLFPSVRLGSKIFGLDWRIVWQDIMRYTKISDAGKIFKELSTDVLVPSIVGFLVIAFFIAAISYAASLFLIIRYRSAKINPLGR